MMVEEQRAAPRFSVQVPTEYEDAHTGCGHTENVSLSGVLIEHASISIAIQTRIRLRFSFFMGSALIPSVYEPLFHISMNWVYLGILVISLLLILLLGALYRKVKNF